MRPGHPTVRQAARQHAAAQPAAQDLLLGLQAEELADAAEQARAVPGAGPGVQRAGKLIDRSRTIPADPHRRHRLIAAMHALTGKLRRHTSGS